MNKWVESKEKPLCLDKGAVHLVTTNLSNRNGRILTF